MTAALPPPRRRVARPAVTGLATALAAATLALVPASPASAAASSAISDARLEVSTQAALDTPATDPCAATEPHGSEVARVVADGRQGLSTDDEGLFTNGDAPTDTVSTAGSAGAVATSTFAGDVRRISLSGEVAATNDAALGAGTACEVEVDSSAQLVFDLEVLRPGWLDVRLTGARYGEVGATLFGGSTNADFDINDSSGSSVNRFWVPAGGYIVFLSLDIARYRDAADEQPLPETVRARMSSSVTFTPAGTATAPATGAGTRAVTFPATLGCGSRSARLTWRAAAGGKPAAVRVNGRTVRRTTSAKPGRSVTVRSLAPTSRVTLVVRVGRATARRTYEACRAPGF